MPLLKNIVHDLVEKRLWPVALALVAALVAVPVVLGGGSAPAPAPPASATPAPGSGRAAVSLDTTASSGSFDRGGRVRNPFKQPKVKAAATPGAAGTTGATPGASDRTGGGGGAGGSTDSTTTPGTTAPGRPGTAARPDSLDTFRLTLRFGQAGSLRTLRDLARLSPLPSADTPFFVYLGVLKDGKTAVFLVSSDVKATGDGHCRPSASDCQTVEVKEGDTEFFDLERDGQPVQYEMDVLHLDRTSDAQKQVTAAAARAAASRHSEAGAAALRAGHAHGNPAYDGADGYRWLPDRGVLARVPARAGASAAGGGATPARRALPGLPVWHAELTV